MIKRDTYTVQELMRYNGATRVFGLTIRVRESDIIYYFRLREDGFYEDWFVLSDKKCLPRGNLRE